MKYSTLGRLSLVAGLAVAVLATRPATGEAQNAIIRGAVRSDNGEPIGGATVFIAELSVQAATSEAGQYVITVPGERTRGQQLQLRVRAIGYRPSSRPVTLTAGTQTVDFALAADVNRLEEIVVTGVLEGTEQAKVPFAVSRVDMADVPVTPMDPLRLLAGRVPGANITSFNGRPGASPDVVLRGPHSINASGRSQGPLYIVDGTIITGSLPDLNPADIDNVEVVKGAAASSLYGARGGNGVIAITTRSGRRAADGMSFNARTEYGRSDIERDFGIARNTALIMDSRDERFCRNLGGFCTATVDWATEAARINNEPGDVALSAASLAFDPGASTTPVTLRNNYQAQLFPGRVYNAVEQAVTNNELLQSNVDATGRFGSTQFFASGSYLRQAGALRFVEGFSRYTGRLNVDQRIASAWTLALRSYFSRSSEDLNSPDFFRLTRAPAIVNTMQRDTLGRLYVRPNIQASGLQNENPLYVAENLSAINYNKRFLGDLTLRYAPLSWLDMEGQFAYDYANGTREDFQDKGYRSTQLAAVANGSFLGQPYLGYAASRENNAQSYNTGLNVNMRRSFGRDISTRWTLRYAYDQQDNDARFGDGTTLNAVGVRTLNNASVRNSITSSFSSIRGTSFSAGANAEIKERYILDAAIRREGSSLFGSDSRWSTFGRVSLAWRLSHEPWWFGSGLINDLKLRGSYGTAGGRPQFNAQYETFTVGSGGINFGALGNRNLRPEKTFDTEVGLDAELLHRVGVNLTYDVSETRDQIQSVIAPADKGFGTQWQNIGTLQNKTWELSVNVPVIQRRDVSWSMRFSYDRTRTMITKLGIPPQTFGTGATNAGATFQLRQGEAYGTFYGAKFLTSCSELPDHTAIGGPDFRTQCGTPTSQFQVNDEGFVVWTGGYGVGEGITRNLWTTQLGTIGTTNANAPWGRPIFWGMPITVRDSVCIRIPSASCPTLQTAVGHALPNWNFSITQTFNWRRLSVYGLLQGVMGRDVWNEGAHWAHLDLLSHDVDQAGKSVETSKPIGYYWRGGPPINASGVGGFYDALAANSKFVEDASFAKLRELAVSYNFGPVGGVGNWTASLVGRNLFTITNYTGFDPEVGATGGLGNSGLIGAVDSFTFPNTRSLTFGLSTSF